MVYALSEVSNKLEADQPLTLRWHENYDHGYYFISTFIEDHIEHQAASLNE